MTRSPTPEHDTCASQTINTDHSRGCRYIRYYTEHSYGDEFFEFEIKAQKNGTARLRYANGSDIIIRKEVYLSSAVLDEFERIVRTSGILELPKDVDKRWPTPDGRTGSQELDVLLGDSDCIAWRTIKIFSLSEISRSKDPSSLEIFHNLVQDLKSFVLSLINMHFKARPII